jgi:8-oxo-dGTP pyrophosphatase MutT (NUDIX family)
MNFEPQKFFVGLMDFFSVLLPGGVLIYLVKADAGTTIWGGKVLPEQMGPEAVAVFLVASYVLGHFLFSVGAKLDDWIYDPLRRRCTSKAMVKQMARRGTLPPWLVRVIAYAVFKQERDIAVIRAGQIKAHMLAPMKATGAVNNFQWAKAFLAKEHAESLAMVHRFEADSKFFRSFVVVLLILSVYWATRPCPRLALSASALLLTWPALWRYLDQRYKATNQAYWSVITLVGRDGKIDLRQKDATGPQPSHAGGVVVKHRWWRRDRYLLVESKDDPTQWVLPKGHVEEAESHREAAVREVKEECGVWARIEADLGESTFTANGNPVTVKYYLMKYKTIGRAVDRDRHIQWLTLEEAIDAASHVDTRELLDKAAIAKMQKARERNIAATTGVLNAAEREKARR